MKILIAVIFFASAGFGIYLFSDDAARPVPSMPRVDTVRAPVAKLVVVANDPNPFVQAALREFEAFVNTAIVNGQAPGAAVAIVKDTSIIFLKGFGLRDARRPDSVNTQTVFRLGSVSKSVTATLAAVLVNQNIIHWDDPVIHYLPDFQLKSMEATRRLTLRHVLSHTIGLPYHAFTVMVEDHAPFDTLVNHLKDLNLIAQPGELYSYQNVGFSLIGKVIERATGQKLEDVFAEKLFAPLGMTQASASYQKIIANGNVAMPHIGRTSVAISPDYYSVVPAGGLNASIQDMAVWLQALLGQRPAVLPDSSIDQMLSPEIRAVTRNYNFRAWKPVRKSYYALGWRVITFRDDTVAYHGGYVNHYRCEVAVNRKKKIAIALLVNSAGMLADQGVPRFFGIYDRYLDSIHSWKPGRPL